MEAQKCPRCGFPDVTDPACPRCGVVFAKLAVARSRPAPPPRPPTPPPTEMPERGSKATAWVTVCFVLVVGVGMLYWLRGRSPRSPDATIPLGTLPSAPPIAAPSMVESPPSGFTPPQTGFDLPSTPPAARDPDIELIQSLTSKVNQRMGITPADIDAAESLASRRPDDPDVKELLGAVLMLAARDHATARRFAEAAALYRRASAVLASAVPPRLGLMSVSLSLGNWSDAEAAAREALDRDTRNADALEGLAQALFRQDRDREAAEAARSALEVRESSAARTLLAQIEKRRIDESGMTERRISHFNVRYDGDAHEEVGREILKALERHYATLVTSLSCEPKATVAVILFTRERYQDTSGAPIWAGGHYDNTDGRIRIPIGGLDTSLSRGINQTLIHELVHAFLADCTRGVAPREFHEGLAQYMEGKRLASLLRPEELQLLANNQVQGVAAFYMQALSFVEYLYSVRGQGGINEVIQAMGQTGSADQAFRQTYSRGYGEMQEVWMDRMRRLYGS